MGSGIATFLPPSPRARAATPFSVVAIGDSVTAGEGIGYGYNWVRRGQYGFWKEPIPWPSNWLDSGLGSTCHRSAASYGAELADNYLASWSPTFTNLACTGATTLNVTTTTQSHADTSPVNTAIPVQIGPAYDAAHPDLVVLSAGADDLDFAKIVTGCYTPSWMTWADPSHSDYCNSDDANNYVSLKLGLLKGDLNQVLSTIYQHGVAAGKIPTVLLMTYYDPFPDPYQTCADTAIGPGGLGAPSPDDFSWMTTQLERLNGVIQYEGSLFPFVHVVQNEDAMDGHRWCQGNGSAPWVYGPDLRYNPSTNDPNSMAPFHPTPDGQAQLAADAYNTLSSDGLFPPTPPPSSGSPQTPGDVSAIAGSGSAEVTWSETPQSRPVGYEMQVSPALSGHHQLQSVFPPTEVTGLTPGQAYSFRVRAYWSNISPTVFSSWSSWSQSIIPTATAPSAPQATAYPGDSSVTLIWSPPASGGSPILYYTIQPCTPGWVGSGSTTWGCPAFGSPITVPASATSDTVTGLTNGQYYEFQTTAANALGTSPIGWAPNNKYVMPTSPTGAAPAPGGRPTAPTGVTASPAVAGAHVTWTRPASSGTSPINYYVITVSPGGVQTTAPSTAATADVTGLTPGTSFTFTVTATNLRGTGPASTPSNAVVPLSPAPQMIDLGTLFGPQANSQARAINDFGVIVGQSDNGSTEDAALWQPSSGTGCITDAGTCYMAVNLGTLGGGGAVARAINSSGVVVGGSITPGNVNTHATIWTPPTTVGNSYSKADLGVLDPNAPYTGYSQAYGINSTGQIAGESSGSANDPNSHAVVWIPSSPAGAGYTIRAIDGTLSAGYAINNSGTIAGAAYLDGTLYSSHAVLWQPSATSATGYSRVDLAPGAYGGWCTAEAKAVNNSGYVAGSYCYEYYTHAAVWSPPQTPGGPYTVTNLGGSGSNISQAYGIDSSGDVIGVEDESDGTHAMLWKAPATAGGTYTPVDLGSLGPWGAVAYGMNDNGQAVGYSELSSYNTHAFVASF